MMRKKSLNFFIALFAFATVFLSFLHGENSSLNKDDTELPFVIVVPSYNNYNWFRINLNSLFMQRYKNYRLIYIDDCSNDGMREAIEQFLEEENIDYRIIDFDTHFSNEISIVTKKFGELINQENHFFTLVRNVHRYGAMANLYRSIHSCKDHEIVAVVDGDDWLCHDLVLKQLNKTYSAGEIWLTHGRLIEYPSGFSTWCLPIPTEITSQNRFREFRAPSHLRTFYAWLFKKIKLEDLLYEGQFFQMTSDMAMMYPMIEMASERHAFISQVNYIYNTNNPLNDNKVNPQLQRDMDRYIRQMPPYHRLEKRE